MPLDLPQGHRRFHADGRVLIPTRGMDQSRRGGPGAATEISQRNGGVEANDTQLVLQRINQRCHVGRGLGPDLKHRVYAPGPRNGPNEGASLPAELGLGEEHAGDGEAWRATFESNPTAQLVVDTRNAMHGLMAAGCRVVKA